jgi:hypothetical protein
LAGAQASPVPVDALLYEAVLPAYRPRVIADTAHRLSTYTIAATLHPPGPPPTGTPEATPWAEAGLAATPPSGAEATPASPAGQGATITGTLELRFVNGTGGPLTDLYLRLSPNLRQYGDGRMVVRGVTVDGVPVAPTPPPLSSAPAVAPAAPPDPGSADLALLRLPLAGPLGPGGAATVRLGFATTVPAEPQDGAGLFRFAPDAGSWVLGHWFPILAGYDPESGWETDPPAAWGDPTFADAALFDVTLAAPADLVLVTTGSEVAGEADGQRQVRRFVGGPARDFAVVADPGLASVGAEVGGTTVTSYHRPQDAAGGELILGWAARSLAVFAELFGPYPYAELDLVAVPGVVGHEFPQLVFVGADYYPDPAAAGSRPGAVEFLVAHEVAHQWWYGLVGSNPHRHAFLDEGLAEYGAVLAFERRHGAEAAGAQLDAGLVLPYAAMLLTEGDRVVDRPTADFPDAAAYHATAYAKAGLGFAALRREVGDAAFFAGLRRYAETERFRVAAPADLRSAFEAAAGRDLGPFWRAWFEGTGGRVEVVVDPAPAAPPGASPIPATPTQPTPTA